MAEFVTGVLVAAGILNAPKVLKDFVDICSSIRKAIDRYVDAKNLYEKLLDKVMGFQEQALRLLKSISKIVKRLSPQEKASFNNMLKGIHLELLGWRKWVEENRIKPHDGIWDTFVKKMKAGLGRDLRDAQEAVDEMSKKLGQIDQRLDLNYRELNYKVGRDNQKAIKRVEESQIRIEEGQENLKRALTWVGRNQARLEKRQAAAEKRQAAAEKKMEDIGRTVVASLRNGLADPPSYDEAMRDSDDEIFDGLSPNPGLSDIVKSNTRPRLPSSHEKKERRMVKANYRLGDKGNHGKRGNVGLETLPVLVSVVFWVLQGLAAALAAERSSS